MQFVCTGNCFLYSMHNRCISQYGSAGLVDMAVKKALRYHNEGALGKNSMNKS